MGEVGWTEDAEAHIARHGTTPTEVEEAIYSRPRLVARGRDFIVTARGMTGSEQRRFRERGR